MSTDYDVDKVNQFVADAKLLKPDYLWRLFSCLANLSSAIVGSSEESSLSSQLVDSFCNLPMWERANVIYKLTPEMQTIAIAQAKKMTRLARAEDSKQEESHP